MIKYFISILILICLHGSCFANQPSPVGQSRYAGREYYAGVLALVAVQKTDSVDPVKCQCNGSGRSGDGLSVCQCGADCKCIREARPIDGPIEIEIETPEYPKSKPLKIKMPKTQLLFFSTANCTPCDLVKGEFEKMNKTGWKIDTSRTAHILTSDQAEQFGVHSFPCFIRMVNGQEVSRSYGYMNSYSILDFYNGVTQ